MNGFQNCFVAKCLVLALFLKSSPHLLAATYSWFPVGDGTTFSDPGNWYDLDPAADPHNPSGPPGAGDIAIITSSANVVAGSGRVAKLNGTGTAKLTLTGPFFAQSVDGGGMQLSGSGTLSAQTVSSFLTIIGGHLVTESHPAGSLSVDAGGSLVIQGGVQSSDLPAAFLFNVTAGSSLEVRGAAMDVDGNIDGGAHVTLASLVNLNASQSTLSVRGAGTRLDIHGGAQVRNSSFDVSSGSKTIIAGALSFEGANGAGTSTSARSIWRGAGTEVTVGGGLNVGTGAGSYSLELFGGPLLASGSGIVLGREAGASGTLNLTDGSEVQLGGAPVIVGYRGLGNLTLDSSASITAGKMLIGQSPQNNRFDAGRDTIIGALDEIVVGAGGLGALRFHSGAQAIAKRFVVGRQSQANNMATLHGAGTTLTGSGRIDVGEANGRGWLQVQSEAEASPGEGLSVGIYDGSTGTLDITDNGKLITAGGTAILGGGSRATSSTTITRGGQLSALDVLVFAKPSGASTVAVAAAPSDTTPTLLSATDQLEVGFAHEEAGPALVTATGGAFISAGKTLLVGQNGILNTSGGKTKVGVTDFPAAGTVRVGAGGVLGGSGRIIGNIQVDDGGKLAPGASPGVLTIQGTGQIKSGGRLEIEVSGAAAGTDFDQIHLTGSCAISGGVLAIRFIDGFSPRNGQSYTFLQAGGGITGTFTNIEVTGVAAGFAYHTVSGSGGLSLRADNDGTATSPPRLRIARQAGSFHVSWPSPGTWSLQSATNPAGAWSTVPGTPAIQNGRSALVLPNDQPRSYFRLRP